MPLRNAVAALFLLGSFGFASHAQTTALNLSEDLISNGIASSNMIPGEPALDSRPLLEAAIAYAAAHGVTSLTADPGAYYFLSTHNPNTHVLINGASNLQLDLRNSTLLFAFGNLAAIQCTNCTNVTLENFSVDYRQLPFTQVTVSTVNASGHSFTYQTIPGYQDPTAFNTNRAPDGSDAIFMFVFRNGVPITQVGRLSASRPVAAGTIVISDTGDPWATPAALASMQPGDTVVFTDRSGPPAVNIVSGKNVAIEGVSVYSSGQIGIYFGRTDGATADHDQVIPAPGTTRLISTNADGIHTSFALDANIFTNNIVRRTCDDALAISASWLAGVTKVDGASVTVARNFSSPFPPGVTLAFINPANAVVIGTATISSENPAFDQQAFTAGESVTLTLDHAVPGLAAGFGVMDTDPAKLGSGSVIANNTVQEGVFSRGVWLAGVQNVAVHDNFIQRTSSNGIFVQELNANNTDAGPSSGITIQNNLVDASIGYANVSHGVAFAAASIYTVAQDQHNAQVSGSPHSNISVLGNQVTNAARSAIRVENVNGGQVANNSIQGFGLEPSINVFSAPACCETLGQFQSDFSQAILTPSSVSIATGGNSISAATSALGNSSTASGYPRLGVGSFAAAYGSNLAQKPVTAPGTDFQTQLGGVTVSITDSQGVNRLAPIQFVSAGQVNYLVPDGTAPGIATVTIGSSSGAAQIDTVGPGLYSMNGANGVAAANAALYAADGTSTPVQVFQCNPDCTAVPMNAAVPGQELVLSFYGTGFRNVASPQDAALTIGGVPAQILYIGAQPTYPGLDQLNAVVPASLAGSGPVPVVLTVDEQTANAVLLNIQ